MKKIYVRPFKSVGNHRLVLGRSEYGLIFENVREAQSIADEIHKYLGLAVSPKVKLTNQNTKRLMGKANHASGLITLHVKGRNVGCLLHELAHLHPNAIKESNNSQSFRHLMLGRRFRKPRRISHGSAFKNAQMVIYSVWDKIKHKYISNISPAAETKPRPVVKRVSKCLPTKRQQILDTILS